MLSDRNFWIGVIIGISAPMIYHWFTGNLPCKTS